MPGDWTPVRYVRTDVVCSFCRFTIRAGSPVARVGERGTRAYYHAGLREWECLGCRGDAMRAESAFAELAGTRRRARPCSGDRCDHHIRWSQAGTLIRGSDRFAAAYAAGTVRELTVCFGEAPPLAGSPAGDLLVGLNPGAI